MVGVVNRSAAVKRLFVDSRAFFHIVRNVRDVHTELVAVFGAGDRNRVVDILCICAVDSENRLAAQIKSAGNLVLVGFINIELLCFRENLVGELGVKPVHEHISLGASLCVVGRAEAVLDRNGVLVVMSAALFNRERNLVADLELLVAELCNKQRLGAHFVGEHHKPISLGNDDTCLKRAAFLKHREHGCLGSSVLVSLGGFQRQHNITGNSAAQVLAANEKFLKNLVAVAGDETGFLVNSGNSRLEKPLEILEPPNALFV